jgi:hypothetical protein
MMHHGCTERQTTNCSRPPQRHRIYLISQKCLEKKLQKNYKNHLRSNNYEECTTVALSFPNILDVMVLESIDLSSDRNRGNNYDATQSCYVRNTFNNSDVENGKIDW